MALFSVCSVYEACRLVCLLYLFIYLFIYCVAWRGVAFRVAFMGHWGGTLVAFTAFAAFIRRLGWSFFCPFRVFAAVRGLWGGTLVAFTVLVVFSWAMGLVSCGAFRRL